MSDGPVPGQICTADEMNSFIKGKHQGGIRYSGNFPDFACIGVILGGGADAIYPDEHLGSLVRYIGEGQKGDQRLTHGNRALAWAFFHKLPVHVFVHKRANRYEYDGAYLVESVSSTIATDRNGADRGAFSFELARPGSGD